MIDALLQQPHHQLLHTGIGGSPNMNIDKLRAAAKAMNRKTFHQRGRHLLMHSSQLDALLGETETTSADFATVKSLVRGEINSFMGFNIITMGDRDEGGVPKPSTRSCFAWHQDSMGYAESMSRSRSKLHPRENIFLSKFDVLSGCVTN